MPRYELNELGKMWIYEAEDEEAATFQLINEVCQGKTIQAYYDYCEEVGGNFRINWKEVKEEAHA